MDEMHHVSKVLKQWKRTLAAHAVCVVLLCAHALTPMSFAATHAAPSAPAAAQTAPAATATPDVKPASNIELKATSLSGGFAEITGLAISPLVVMSLFGAVDWWNAPAGAPLPLHANPWFWGTLLGLVVIGQSARWLTMPLPMPIRKLFDAVHYLESKCSALLAVGVLLPSIVSAMSHVGGDPNQIVHATVLAPNTAIAGMPSDVVTYLGALALFAVVWIVSHAIDALVLLSPFALIDALLLSARATILALLLGAIVIHPVFGFIVALPIVLFCILVAGWCVRLDIFATTCAWDLLSMRWHRVIPHHGPIRAFLALPRAGLPIRTRGTIVPNGASMTFHYRRWFIMPTREVDLGAHPSALVRGVVWSTFVATTEQGGGALVAIPPRYRSHEAIVAARFGAEPKDGLIWRGLGAIWAFIRNPFGRRTPTAAVQ